MAILGGHVLVGLKRRLIGQAAMIGILSASAAQADVQVAATIAPVHSLVSMVMEGVGEPALIIKPGASPHHYALRPSEARAIDEADLVFWVGAGLEPWMSKSLETLAADAQTVELGAVDGLVVLEARAGGVWERHDHAGHDDHDDHAGHNDHAELEKSVIDPHLWLDPNNGLAWIKAIETALTDLDPDHAEFYQANAEAAAITLREMTAAIEQDLEAAKGRPYLVFHDAYHYFERHFDLTPVGSIRLGDADRPSAARLTEIRERMTASGAQCAFTEPQFDSKLLDSVIEGSPVTKGILDPIGVDLDPGPTLYPNLLKQLALSLATCLS